MLYRRVPQCRVCTSEHGDKIDRDLVARLPYNKIVEKRGSLFPPEKPLTKACLFSHWKHLKDAVDEIVATEIASIRHLPATLNPGNPAMPDSRQIIFQEMVESRLDEIATIKKLADSGLKDLELLEKTRDNRLGPSGILVEDADDTLTRNKVRRDTAAVIEASAKVKNMATEADEDLQRLDKARLVFRMFELMKNALSLVPETIRPLVTNNLKDGLRADDELRELLRTHRTQGRVVEPAEEVSSDGD